ncbi:MAG: NAD(P)H-dependent oxidoreductase subunit E [Desulfobacterales bacterium]|nr:NAD(P)H-dependent oxidoreductase subunit E [Desulfobacterales bacterium]
MTKEELNSIIEERGTGAPPLVGILQEIQKREHCLPFRTLEMVAERLATPMSRLYSLATFYKSFTLKPVGRHAIDVCLGTTCHVCGGRRIMDRLLLALHVIEGGTTSDHRFTVTPVRCLGCCSIAPVIRIDSTVYGHVTQSQLAKILEKHD